MTGPSIRSVGRRLGRTMLFACCCVLGIAAQPGASEPPAEPASPQRLTDDGTLKLSPTFMPDGKAVVFATHEAPNLASLWRLKFETGERERLHPNAQGHQFDPAFSRDGRLHAYCMSSTSPQMVLVLQNLEKETESIFRPRDARATARSPSIAPDGSRVVFSLSDVQGHQLASVDMQGANLAMLTATTGMNAWPAFSPDGKQIAFSSSRDGDLEIYTMDANGANPKRLTTSAGRDMRPVWSPDGRRIAFCSARDGNLDVYVMQADGSSVTNVTQHPERDDYPVWHPEGGRILTISERDGKSDLYLFDAPAP